MFTIDNLIDALLAPGAQQERQAALDYLESQDATPERRELSYFLGALMKRAPGEQVGEGSEPPARKLKRLVDATGDAATLSSVVEGDEPYDGDVETEEPPIGFSEGRRMSASRADRLFAEMHPDRHRKLRQRAKALG